MKYTPIFILIVCVIVFTNCEKSETIPETPEVVEPDTLQETSDSIPTESFCIPPFGVDTCNIQMKMQLDGITYDPTANFACILPNIFLGLDQLWVNGSTPIALKVVSLLMPVDITPGTYSLQLNSPYDARYVPSGSINFSVDFGTLIIAEHDTINNYIEGTFEFIATNLDSPVLPTIEITEGCFEASY